jgi:hypothetical protein
MLKQSTRLPKERTAGLSIDRVTEPDPTRSRVLATAKPNNRSVAPSRDPSDQGRRPSTNQLVGRQPEGIHESMLSRTTQSSFAGRSASMRRMRRRTTATGRIYCGTNGCASFLRIDPDRKVASCDVCGYTRRLD